MTSAVETWLQEQTAKTSEDLANGDGNHPEEIDALRKFLTGNLTAQEVAIAITRPITLDEDPPSKLYRLWGLLADALVEQGREVGQKSLDLLAAVQTLPPTPTVNWSDLPGFGHMWSDLHGLHFHGPPPWEQGREGALSSKRKSELCHIYEDTGMAEGRLWLRIPNAINPDQGYRVLNLACSQRAGIWAFLHQIHGWLEVAGTELWVKMKSYDKMSLPKPGSKEGYVNATMEEHWSDWERALADLSGGTTSLSAESKSLAAECLKMMQDARKQDPRAKSK